MNVRPIGDKTHKIEFLMPHYAHTGYHNKHNHEGRVAHRFLVELSYARQSKEKTPLKELSEMINYAETYILENHVVSHGHSRTHSDLSKVALYVPLKHAKRVEELLYELRYTIGIVHAGERHGEKGHVIFNTSQIQDYLAD